ncbi:MAG: DUF397 domain-containing protein [Actinobacteria bacterium]|nr:DUF397 domain-containing protein [Actinomycetota bacterium]
MNHTRRAWRKSSYSTPDGQCVEIADTSEGIDLRDSKDHTGPVLSFDRPAWTDFIATIKQGGFG